jgi:hypothetical protein
MNADQRVETLEGEVKLLKNEIQAVLLDIREHYLNYQNPFAQGELPSTVACDAPEADADDPGRPLDNEVVRRTTGDRCTPVSAEPELTANCTEDERALPAPIEDQPEAVRRLPPMREVHEPAVKPKLGLKTIAGLNQWVDETATVIGRSKLEALVEVCCMEGQLPADIKDVVLVLAGPCSAEVLGKRTTGKQYLTALSRLNDVLGTESQGSTIQSSLMFVDRKPGKKRAQSRKRARAH